MSTALILRRDIDHGVIDRAILKGFNALTREAIRAGATQAIPACHPHARSIREPLLALSLTSPLNGNGIALTRDAVTGEPFAVCL